MPLYEYKCVKCGHRFERIEKVTASEVKKCPECGAKAERMAAAPAIQFKGSGWYVTDYAGKNSGGTSKDSKEAKDSTDSKEAKDSKTSKESPASKTSDKALAAAESSKGSPKKAKEK
ncbi:MAG TPA: FmdB family zinc ribbon protein [Candidatus Acidoferrales bacterium]|nr:FmdB family zinc ribbon protein [Candidatus Acidoferrales bacterium]